MVAEGVCRAVGQCGPVIVIPGAHVCEAQGGQWV